MIAITIDIDWAPEEAVEDILKLLEDFGVRATIFATHKSEVLLSCNSDLFELAIHPNFNNLLNGKSSESKESIFKDIVDIYPHSKGVRSHSMVQSSPILNMFSKYGMLYECNQFIPYNSDIKPYKLWNGMIRIPYNWEDDIHFLYRRSFKDLGMNIDHSGNYIFDFHPIHTFVNTPDLNFYNSIKEYYHQPSTLLKKRNKKEYGIRNCFVDLLKKISKSGFTAVTLSQVDVNNIV